MALNEIGVIVKNEWFELNPRFNHIKLHEFIVMTNHIHGIIEIVGVLLVVARKPMNNELPKSGIIAKLAWACRVKHRAEVNPAPTNKTSINS